MARSLDSEIAYFDAHLDQLREAAPEGRCVVVIRGREVQGYFDSVVVAANFGYEKFSPEPFLVRSVEPERYQPAIASIFPAG